jgi:hypothetical protein
VISNADEVIRMCGNLNSQDIKIIRISSVDNIQTANSKKIGFRKSKDPLFNYYDNILIIDKGAHVNDVFTKYKYFKKGEV